MKAEGEVRGFSQLQMLMQPKRVCGFIPVVLLIKTAKMHLAFCPVVQPAHMGSVIMCCRITGS